MCILAVVAAAALQRLGELGLARRWLRRSTAGTGALPDGEPGFALMVAVHAAWLLGCAAEPLLWPRPVLPLLAWAMGGLWLGALALRVWTLSALRPYWHVRVIRRERQPVVTRGPYRFIRHPNYLVVIVEVAAVPLLLGAYGTALLASLANAALLAARIRREEAYLFTLPAYRAAFERKARLLPGLF